MFFKLSEKQLVVLSKQPIVLLLGVFEKLKTVLVGWHAVKPKQSIVSCNQSIVCLKILTKFVFVSWVCFKWFSNWIRSCFKCFDQSLKAINNLFMFYRKQEKRKTDLRFSEIAFKIWYSTIQLWFSQERVK